MNDIQNGKAPEALVADDDELVCQTVARMLECLGFSVRMASDGYDALCDVESSDESLKVVVMDVAMPRMDGLEASRRIHDVRPSVPVILASGTYDFRSSPKDAFCGNAFLQKPFSLSALQTALRDVGC